MREQVEGRNFERGQGEGEEEGGGTGKDRIKQDNGKWERLTE